MSTSNASTLKRFEVSIAFSVEEMADGERTPFFDGRVDYHDIGYDGVVAVQAVMTEMLERLNGLGFEVAEAMGLGDKLKTLGVTKKR